MTYARAVSLLAGAVLLLAFVFVAAPGSIDPMFGNPAAPARIPIWTLIVLGAAFVGLVAGLMWIRRITTPDDAAARWRYRDRR